MTNTANTTLRVHHLRYSQSSRILLLMEELGLDYELVSYDRGPDMLAPPTYKAVSPTGTAPVIEDGDVVLAETSAIIEYVLTKYADSKLRPASDDPRFARYLFWFHAMQGSLQPLLLMRFLHSRLLEVVPFFIRPVVALPLKKLDDVFTLPRLHQLLGMLERELGGDGPWVLGELLTAVDILMSYSLAGLAERGTLLPRYPNIQAYFSRLQALPSYQRAVQKGGPFGAPSST